MSGDRVIARATKTPEGIRMVAIKNIPQHQLPFGLYGRFDRSVTMYKFIEWASERCFPEERIGASELLKELGLDRYDGWEIVKKTNGVLMTDSFWIDFGSGLNT